MDKDNRSRLADSLDVTHEGDTRVVTNLDPLARSVSRKMEIRDRVTTKGAHLRILELNMVTSPPTGQLPLTMTGGIAAFERAIMRERQRKGIAKAKAEGKYVGRQPTARARADQVLSLKAHGMGASEIATAPGIGRASVCRKMQDAGA